MAVNRLEEFGDEYQTRHRNPSQRRNRTAGLKHLIERKHVDTDPMDALSTSHPFLAFLLFEATEDEVLAMGLDPTVVDTWAMTVDTGMCPEEFGTFDAMQRQVCTKVIAWNEERKKRGKS
jgi:hypothetical protein